MDYGTLAQLSNPGQAAPGDRWGRIRRFQNLNNIQQHALQQSIPLAELAAQKEQQQHQEYMDAAPGRRDLITLGNKNAADKLESFDADKFAAKLKIDVTNAEQMAKLADTTQDFSGDADAYMQALDSGDERLRNQIVKKHEGRKLRNGYVMGTDPNTDDMLLKVAGVARKYAPTMQVKRDVADTGAAAKVATTAMNNKTTLERQRIASASQQAIVQINAKAKENKPLSATEQALMVAFGDGKQIIDQEGASAVLQFKLQEKTGTTEMRLDNVNAQLAAILSGKGITAPEVTRPEPPAPIVRQPAPKTTSGPATTTTNVAPKKPNSLAYEDAVKKLEEFKGTDNEADAINFFVNRYGAENLPQWAKKK